MNEFEHAALTYLSVNPNPEQAFRFLRRSYPAVPDHSIRQIIQQCLLPTDVLESVKEADDALATGNTESMDSVLAEMAKSSNPNDISGKTIQSVTLKFTDGTEATVTR